MTDLDSILKTEYSEIFDTIRKSMMAVSYYKYWPLQKNHGKDNLMDAIDNLKIRLNKYEETGNTEYLADVANFAMIEFMSPQHTKWRYEPTDGWVDLKWFSINSLNNL